MDQLHAMRVFCQIVDSGNMAAAARALGLSAASVTMSLAQMEKRLEARLLDRTTRRINLTEAGRIWYEHAKRILDESSEAENAVRNLASEPRGLLRVTLPLGVAMRFVYPHLDAFTARYPMIDLDLQVNDRVIDIIENRFDLALRVGHMRDSELIARPLLYYQRLVCASPAYLKRHGEPYDPADLAQHQCLLYQHDLQPVTWDFQVEGEIRKVQVKGRWRSNESHALLTWARTGHGLTRQPAWMVADDIRNGTLVTVLDAFVVTQPAALPGIYAILPKARTYPAKVEAFLGFMRDKMEAAALPSSGGSSG